WAPIAGKSLPSRAFAAWWLTFTGFWRALFTRGPLLALSSPPTLGLVLWVLSWLGRKGIYVLHDLHPDLGLALGRLRPGFAASLLRFIQRRNLARAKVVAITQGMAENARRLQPRARPQVIENWVDCTAIAPKPKAESALARAQALAQPFVLQYSGNLGLLHPLDGLVRAMADLPDCVLAFIGRGARLEATRAAAAGLPNVRFLDYVPLAELGDSLAACDVAVVALEPGADRLAMPSKLVGILAAGRPVLALAPEGSELAQLVLQANCGLAADAADPAAIAAAVRRLRDDPALRESFSRNARSLAETRFSLTGAAEAYAALLAEVSGNKVSTSP
ncbi:MAG: glycosyltransferase family 4 protein, partial [Planctomycetes bacterium]|nr:glycosyltransferase family 4 protein [Planctomycetota bacterium]